MKTYFFALIGIIIFSQCSSDPDSTCIDGVLNGDETGIDCGGDCPPCPQIYSIGDRGEANGIVFYDKGDYSSGWRYLEAAPSDQEENVNWGCFGLFIGNTSRQIGFGLENQNVVLGGCNAPSNSGLYERAFISCSNLNIGGKRDWFLPSRDELNQMFLNKNIIGEFRNGAYWSSTEERDEDAWLQEFSTGDQYCEFKNVGRRVRAIRRF